MYNVRDLRHLLRCLTESDVHIQYQYGSSVRPKQIARGPGTSNSVITNIDYFTRHPADVEGVGCGDRVYHNPASRYHINVCCKLQ